MDNTIECNIEQLATLATKMVERYNKRNTLIIPFIGAGASYSAGIPLGSDIRRSINDTFCSKEDGQSGKLAEFIIHEAESMYGEKVVKKGIDVLDFFEYMSVISTFANGRAKIKSIVRNAIKKASKKPLCYELLAHLAKHRFIDHFMSLNFDELLDFSLRDEIPSRLRKILGSEDLPGPHFERDKDAPCFLIKPFGSREKDKFKLEPSEVMQFGSESIWQFCLDRIFTKNRKGTKLEEIVLVLIGYAAAEPAFNALIGKLVDKEIPISIFNINVNLTSGPLEQLKKNYPDLKVSYINSEADDGVSILVQIIQNKLEGQIKIKTKIPVSRHEIISQCMTFDQTENPNIRFITEVILQAVKSRGFFTVEAIGGIERIRRFSKYIARYSINEMIKKGILRVSSNKKYGSSQKPINNNFWLQDFELNTVEMEKCAEYLMELWGITKENNNSPPKNIKYVDYNHIANTYKVEKVEFKQYLTEKLQEIRQGPEIEIRGERDSTDDWLFQNAVHISGILDLHKKTAEVFDHFLDQSDEKIEIFGVWSSGEWLFDENGFAYKDYGQKIIELIEQGKAKLKVVLIEPHSSDSDTISSATSANIQSSLFKLQQCHKEYVKLLKISWWRHNRKITIVKNRNDTMGIYFKRKLASPLISPVYVEGEDCKVLEEMFQHYESKALSEIEENRVG